ncbi:ead/Ea22-like family protein [Klebsiella sp. P1CD1]|uniref:ead/Ea22-like family protein n=1 Tax=Klebsiella sp. P1CD1 TaxID=2267618 RepID=UPI001D0DAB06|nr:ead/Ea22-like family protein [Klebsiella sp. P1CD1]
MTTDITELAQSLKAAAEKASPGNWRAFQYHDGRCGVGGGNHDEIMVCEHISKKRPHDALFIALANPANILALVEALEGRNALVALQKIEIRELNAELEKAQQCIAELESRAVRFVDCDFGAVQHMSGGSTDYCHGFVDGTQNAIRSISAAGIKVEAE